MFKESAWQGEEINLKGFPICPGIAIARPFFFLVVEEKIPEFSVAGEQIELEVARYYKALKKSRKDLLTLQKNLQSEGGGEAAAILGAHLEMMRDPLMTVQVEEEIRFKGKNTEFAFRTVIHEYEKKFSKITDQFFRERLKDVQDISRRIIGHLRKTRRPSLADVPGRAVVFAHELSPSDTAEAQTDCIEAFVTRSGSATSHVAIMARAKGIPFVSNVDFPDFSRIQPECVIVDGRLGVVVLNPSEQTLAAYRKEWKKLKVHVRGLRKSNVLEAQTYDGYRVRLTTNVEMYSEIDKLQHAGGEGVGLFRSEYLFLAKDTFPTEEEQFQAYRNIVEKVGGYPACIRTFDIGGDKFGNFHPSRYELNPYLGCRGIRLMLKEQSTFKIQIRAILRASAFGEVSMLFPMISGLKELRQAKALVEIVKEELADEGIPFNRKLPIGCMIEIPSAAITADVIAQECDFLSIGTNDLVQYSLAVDRSNPAMSYLYNPAHLSIIRLMKQVVEEGTRQQKPVSVCGEIAGDPLFTELLLGLGVHELSVSAVAIPVIKNVIRHISIVDATELVDHVLTLATADEIEAALKEAYAKLQAQDPNLM